MSKNNRRVAFLAFAMYFLTGAACIVVGSSLPHLVKMYGIGLDKVVLLGSAFAVGRVSTVYLTGRMAEKMGAIRILTAGVVLLSLFLFGIPTIPNYYAGLVFAFLGGAGMGAQDTVCPVLINVAFHHHYAGAMSAGQAFFGLGNFATPFLVGVMLTGKLPFYTSYYVLLIVPVAMFVCIPFVRLNQGEYGAKEEQRVKPLFTKHRMVAYGAIIVGDIGYCAVVNAIMTYTSSFAESMGIASNASAFMLTVYNVGCFVGSLAFVWILKYVSEKTVLVFNHLAATAAIAVMLIMDRIWVYFIALAVAGFFLGVLFSVYVTIATRIDCDHISRAGSLMATAGGGSDILTPVITGQMVAVWGVRSSYTYVVVMSVVCVVAAFVLSANLKKEVL